MIRIALCDDEPLQREMMTDLLNMYRKNHHQQMTLDVFADGADLLAVEKEGQTHDLYLLDVMMPQTDGIETARQLRQAGNTGRIIYLTADRDRAVDSYSVQAFYYLMKPADPNMLNEILDRCLEDMKKSGDVTVSVRTEQGTTSFKMSTIASVNAANRRVEYHLTDGTTVESISLRYSFRDTVSEILENDRFALCGVSTVVNLDQVKEIVELDEVVMKDGSELYMSRAALADLKRAWKVK